MTLPLRVRFMLGMLVHTGVVYGVLALGLFLLDREVLARHPDEEPRERRELVLLYGAMLGAFPIALGAMWIVTGRVLRPLNAMLEVAERIGAGQITRRIEAPVASDELGRLARTLNEAFDNYHRLLERLDRFSLDAAHQLRNPLASMRTAAEVCLHEVRSPAEYRAALERIQDDCRRLGHTVEQLLLLARLARQIPAETMEVFDLGARVRDLGEALRPAFEDRGIHLEVRVPSGGVTFRGAPHLLEQALANLLDNALRLTPARGRVRLELGPPAGGRLRLVVADSGPGWKPGVPFDGQPGTLATGLPNREGAGLGLSIVGNIVQAHGGSVQVSVSEWQGACFTLELPATA